MRFTIAFCLAACTLLCSTVGATPIRERRSLSTDTMSEESIMLRRADLASSNQVYFAKRADEMRDRLHTAGEHLKAADKSSDAVLAHSDAMHAHSDASRAYRKAGDHAKGDYHEDKANHHAGKVHEHSEDHDAHHDAATRIPLHGETRAGDSKSAASATIGKAMQSKLHAEQSLRDAKKAKDKAEGRS